MHFGQQHAILKSKYRIPAIIASKHASELSRLHRQSPDKKRNADQPNIKLENPSAGCERNPT